jgi:predicted dehydrogenase
MKSLIVGMGIGNLYKEVLTNLDHEIVTVDLDPSKADFTSVKDAVAAHEYFDTVHICTPNFTHETIAREVATYAKLVFIEKPGVKTSEIWQQLVKDFPYTRFMMVKNNQWRENIAELQALAQRSIKVELNWVNRNRVPGPGTWFTTKDLAYGGVSRDLMTHLLSLYIALSDDYTKPSLTHYNVAQRYTLAEVSDTEYGTVKADGIYDVDDLCEFIFEEPNRKWRLIADWRSLTDDDRGINFHMADGTVERFELGLCPAEAYQAMIKDAVENIDNDAWFSVQLDYDLWIHKKVE